jgi:hypothetical protein
MKIDRNTPDIATKTETTKSNRLDCNLCAIQHKSTVRAARNYVHLKEETKKM